MSFAVAHCVVLCHAPLCKMYERDEIHQNNSRETKQKININKAIVQSSNSFFGALLKFRFTNGSSHLVIFSLLESNMNLKNKINY